MPPIITDASAEQHRNRRLAERIAAGTAVPDLAEVMAGVRSMAGAYLDVPGPRAAQLCDEIERLRAIEQRARNLVTINEPMTSRIARVILGEQP